MDSFAELGYGFCVGMVVTGILIAASPKDGSGKSVRFILRLFLLLCFLLPFAKTDFSQIFSREPPSLSIENQSYDELLQEQLEQKVKENIKTQALEMFDDYGISPISLDVSIHISEENRITVSEMKVILSKEDLLRCDEAVAAVNQAFGVSLLLNREEEE